MYFLFLTKSACKTKQIIGKERGKNSLFQSYCKDSPVVDRAAIIETFHVLQGVLLYGPPGTGKTLLARAVAHHTECTFIRVSGSELVQKFIGEGSRMVRELFVMARYGKNFVRSRDSNTEHRCAGTSASLGL